ncbi:MAG: DUF3168 domain-containing protein [Paracoccus sp. (in: a-proteobacteria)]|nr:DUF3168 domain-containing protein [Paracoccus sp. (in: a-proteobacteria)]
MSVSEVVQSMVVDRLRDRVLAVERRVFDGSAPVDTKTPYLVIGDSQTVLDDADCLEGREEFLTVHVWASARPDLTVARQVTDAVMRAFRLWEPESAGGYPVIEVVCEGARVFPDQNPSFAHGVVQITVVLDEAP